MKLTRPPRWGILLLLATTLLFSIPLIWMVLSSLKPAGQLVEDPYSLLPESWQWSNYSEALDSMPYLVYLANSLLLCTGTVIGSVLSCSLTKHNQIGQRISS